MARRRVARPDRGAVEQNTGASVPSQEDEADIIEEVGAERNEGGEFLTDEESIREVGAVDAASVRENRRLDKVVGKKRANIKDVPFNTDDVLVMYETLIRVWPPNTLDISVRRLTGSGVQEYIRSRPRSGAELFEALKGVHGQAAEAEYEVRFIDNNHKKFRGTGRITLPDTRPPGQQQQGQQPMQYPPPGYPPGYPPQGYPQQQQPYAQQPAPQQVAPVAAPAPQPQQMPQVFDPMAMMGQMFDLFQRMQATVQPPPQPQQPMFVPPQVPAAQPPPMPAPGASPAEMMAWMKQMFELYRQMQPPAQNTAAQQPTMMGMPPAQPPPGMVFVPGIGYVEFARIMRAITPEDQQPQAPYRPRYGMGPQRSSAQPYPPQQGEGGPQQPPYGYPGAHQPPPRTPADSFRESLNVLRSARAMLNEVEGLMPSGGGGAVETPEVEEEDDSPVRVIDTGAGKLVVNKHDGSTRPWETMLANSDKVFKWMGEQADRIQKARSEQAAQATQEERRRQPPPRRLPPGYVEVTPDYTPPPGYVAVPVEQPAPVQSHQYPQQQQPQQPQQPQQGLAPAPSFVPPQVQGGGRLWGDS